MAGALETLSRIEAYISSCGQCPQPVEWALDALRAELRREIDDPQDAFEDAADALQRAQVQLRDYHGPHREAIQRELVSAAVSLGRARQLRG